MSHADVITPTRTQRIRDLHAEHPDLTAPEAAKNLGIAIKHFRALSTNAGLTWAPAPIGRPRTVDGETPKRGNAGSPGQAKPNVILHRIDGRQKAERARQAGKIAHHGQEAFRAPGRVDVDGDGVDATHLIAFADRRVGKDCSWIPGDPADGAMCCGKPVKENSQWCPKHHARVYSGRPSLAS